MPCIIELRKMTMYGRRGSMLMEFLLVLPIYLCLFGFVFTVGEMELRTVSLASGDRAAAHDAGDRGGFTYLPFALKQLVEIGLGPAHSNTQRAEEEFRGSWSWFAGGYSEFMYHMASWNEGWLSYPMFRYGSESFGGGVLVSLSGGGAVLLKSKEQEVVRTYNYYTLKRTDLAREDGAYRQWDEPKLVDGVSGVEQYWFDYVYGELYADSDANHLDGARQSVDELPDQPKGMAEYERYSKFKKWSK